MPANEYYDSNGSPASGGTVTSATIRAEFDAIETGFNKLPILSGNELYVIRVDATGTELEAVAFSTLLSNYAPSEKLLNVTVGANEKWIINNKSGSSLTVTLPSAASYSGREIGIKNLQAYTVISASSNVEPIGSGTPGTAILPATAGAWALLVSDGSNWIIMQSGA